MYEDIKGYNLANCSAVLYTLITQDIELQLTKAFADVCQLPENCRMVEAFVS